jgi:hypothetical protein
MTNKYFGNTRAAKAIYGIILSFVLLYGLDHLGAEDGVSIAIKLLLGAVSITVAEIYAETVGERISKKSKLHKSEKSKLPKMLWLLLVFQLFQYYSFCFQR